MEKKNVWKIICICIIILGLCIASFFWGRKTIYVKPHEPVYIKGDTVKVEVSKPYAVYEKIPADTLDIISYCVKNEKYVNLFPIKVKDSLIYIPTSIDTLSIVKDWATERKYKEVVFDRDTLGYATVSIVVKYNRVQELEASVVPVIKEVELPTKIKKYSPFIGAGLTSMPAITVQGGLFFEDKYGASLLYQYEWQQKKHILGVMGSIKF